MQINATNANSALLRVLFPILTGISAITDAEIDKKVKNYYSIELIVYYLSIKSQASVTNRSPSYETFLLLKCYSVSVLNNG